LKSKLRERESSVADSTQQAQALKHDLEVARSEQHRLEDEIVILQEELEALQGRVKDHEKSKVDSQILAESEVIPTKCTSNHSATATSRRK
jgi:predicted  nucleic acid-binding Zn-ribbon protein